MHSLPSPPRVGRGVQCQRHHGRPGGRRGARGRLEKPPGCSPKNVPQHPGGESYARVPEPPSLHWGIRQACIHPSLRASRGVCGTGDESQVGSTPFWVRCLGALKVWTLGALRVWTSGRRRCGNPARRLKGNWSMKRVVLTMMPGVGGYIASCVSLTAVERPSTANLPSWRRKFGVVVSTAMTRYELEIRESDGWVTHAIHDSPDEVRYDAGDQVEHKGRMLRVAILETPSRPLFDQRLICTPQ